MHRCKIIRNNGKLQKFRDTSPIVSSFRGRGDNIILQRCKCNTLFEKIGKIFGNAPNFVKPKYKFTKEYFSMYKIYHTSCDLLIDKSRFICYRWMHPSPLCCAATRRATMSCFATSTQRECTTVLDLCGAGARREIDHDAPPQV